MDGYTLPAAPCRFLFREHNVGQPKSKAATAMAQAGNRFRGLRRPRGPRGCHLLVSCRALVDMAFRIGLAGGGARADEKLYLLHCLQTGHEPRHEGQGSGDVRWAQDGGRTISVILGNYALEGSAWMARSHVNTVNSEGQLQ